MLPDARLAATLLGYRRALAAARVAPTPRRWRKLLIAARALASAKRQHERRRLAALSPSARRLAVAPRSDVVRVAALVQLDPARAHRSDGEGPPRPGGERAAPAPTGTSAAPGRRA